MAILSSILAWRSPWTEEPGGLQSTGSQRVRHHRASTHGFRISTLSCSDSLIMDSNLQHRGKKVSFHKECCFGPPGLSPPSHAFSKEQDLAGAFLHKCKYNYYLCISIHPQVVKDNTTALTITIPPFSCPAELQMLLHQCGFDHNALCHHSFYSGTQGGRKFGIIYNY